MGPTPRLRPTSALAASLLLAAWAPGGASAQLPDGWPRGIEVAAAAQVAALWAVAPSRVHLEWGPESGEAPGEPAEFEFVGSGRGGHWLLRFENGREVPTTIRLRAGHRTTVPIAGRPLERGTSVGPGDFVAQDTVLWGPPDEDAYASPEGWTVERAIRTGEALVHPAVRPPTAVATRDPVRLVWAGRGVQVTVAGVARGSGAIGDEIWVRTEAGERLRGTIVAPGVVQLTPVTERNDKEDLS